VTGPGTQLVIDRLAYWYYHPREWLKKIALMDDVYLLNSPFTFQSMEKHAAYCAMLRLGLKVPETVLVPYKNPDFDQLLVKTVQSVYPADEHDQFIAHLRGLLGLWVRRERQSGPGLTRTGRWRRLSWRANV
jgi:hypothetical protein